MEFTRCELNPLKFTWVIPGWSFADNAKFILNYLGVYGISYVTISIIIFLDEYMTDNKRKFSLLIVLISLFQIPTLTTNTNGRVLGPKNNWDPMGDGFKIRIIKVP